MVNTGYGNDRLDGTGNNGIFNEGVILMGDGADTVDALIGNTPGGFSGAGGIIDLGRGNDVLKGFGDGTFKGGDGTDNLILQDGDYTFTPVGDSFAITALGSGATMNINGIETFGGVSSGAFTNVSGGTFKILGGVIVS